MKSKKERVPLLYRRRKADREGPDRRPSESLAKSLALGPHLLGPAQFQARLAAELDRAQRASYPVALVLWDVDGLNLVNRTYGRPTGDRLLQWIVEHLDAATRRTDFLSRRDGDSFLMVLPDTDEAGAVKVADRVLDRVHCDAFLADSGVPIPVALSGAVALVPGDGVDVAGVLDVLDERLAEAKSRGGDQIVGHQDVDGLRLAGHYGGVLDLLCTALAKKDLYTSRHSESVSQLALRLGRAVGVQGESLRMLGIAGLIHDIGKVSIPDRIIRKPGRLTAPEYELLKQHVAFGDGIVRDIPSLRDTLDAVDYHHERFDGRGYPHGVGGQEIPFEGRLLAIADAYSAMTLDRPYRKGMTEDEAAAEVRRCSGSQFDPELANAFLRAALPAASAPA